MSPRDQEIFTLVQRFCVENVGNRINEWNVETLLNRLGRIMGRDAGEDKGNAEEKTGI